MAFFFVQLKREAVAGGSFVNSVRSEKKQPQHLVLGCYGSLTTQQLWLSIANDPRL